jgi:branched-chain amino acid transport system substrate-binding protein
MGNLASTASGVPPLMKIAGKNAQGIHFMTLPVGVWETLPKADPRIQRIVEFRDAYKAKYGDYPVMPNWWIAQNYDVAFLLAEAIKKAGPSVTGASLRTALESIKDFHGVVGSFSFAPDQHAGATGVVIGQIEGDRVILAK